MASDHNWRDWEEKSVVRFGSGGRKGYVVVKLLQFR